jgi:hypothetical protein
MVEVQKHHIQQKTSSIGHWLLSSLFFFIGKVSPNGETEN